MSENARWQRELIAALHLDGSCHSRLNFSAAEAADFRKPTKAESERAVANIRAWRAYLPEACVARMIDDGWQWST